MSSFAAAPVIPMHVTTHEPEEFKLSPVDAFCRTSLCEYLKLIIWSLAVGFLVIIAIICIAKEYSLIPLPNYGIFILLFFALVLLAYLESLHFAVVSIQAWPMHEYAERYPRAVKLHKLVDTPEKIKKFLVGRQFFTLLVVFLIAQCTTFSGLPPNFFGFPPIFNLILLQTGLPGVFITLTFGQLIGQIFVEEFTLQFANFYGCEFVVRLSLFAEWIGICNFSWLLYHIVSSLTCGKIKKIRNEMDSGRSTPTGTVETLDPMSPTEKIRGPYFDTGIAPLAAQKLTLFDYFKYLWSTCVTLGSLAILLYGISIKAYVLPTPVVGGYVIAITMMIVLFYLEGLMIAIVGTQYWDREIYRSYYPRAYRNHELMSQPDNVKRFIIGRQFFTVLTNVMLAQIFTLTNFPNNGSVPPALFYIGVQSGLPGIFIILAFSQLLPELLAAEYPLRFQNMYGSFLVTRISLIFDAIGVGHCAWACYFITRRYLCAGQMTEETGKALEDSKPTLVRVESAEILVMSPKNVVSSNSGRDGNVASV